MPVRPAKTSSSSTLPGWTEAMMASSSGGRYRYAIARTRMPVTGHPVVLPHDLVAQRLREGNLATIEQHVRCSAPAAPGVLPSRRRRAGPPAAGPGGSWTSVSAWARTRACAPPAAAVRRTPGRARPSPRPPGALPRSDPRASATPRPSSSGASNLAELHMWPIRRTGWNVTRSAFVAGRPSTRNLTLRRVAHPGHRRRSAARPDLSDRHLVAW